MKTAFLFPAVLLCLSASAPAASPAKPLSIDMDPAHSFFVAITRRSGLLGFVGHEHGVLATRWSGTVLDSSASPSASSVEIVVETPALIADTPEARRLAELESGGPDDSDRAKIQKTMLGPDVLDVSRFPKIRFKSSGVKSDSTDSETPGMLLLTGDLTLHGVTRAVDVPLKVRREKDGPSHFSGHFKFQMSDFGIDPPSKGGVINVKDEMEIRFELTGR